MESVLSCDILYPRPHIFAVLNAKRYHVGRMDDLVDWGRYREQDWRKVDEEGLTRYPRGR